MGLWGFMTISNLIVPILMIVVGKALVKNPPKTINGVYGCLTFRSRKNQDTWDFAQIYCGKLWRKIGWVMLPLAVIGMLPVIEQNDDMMGWVCILIVTVECIILFVSPIFVEKALARKFDKDGKKIA